MAAGIAQIHVRKHKGHMEVQGFGMTSRGSKYIKSTVYLDATTPDAPGFKDELLRAVKEMLAQEAV